MPSILSILLLVVLQSQKTEKTQLTPRDILPADASAIILAIQDEIYDYGNEDEFRGFETAGPRGPEARFNIYIKPQLVPEKDGAEGVVIYKYPPFGEVIRPFLIAPNGTAYLVGKPSSGFPWTQPNTKTVYMDDEEICRDKHEWQRVLFELDLAPSPDRVRAAVARQKSRVGFSHLESSKTRPRLQNRTSLGDAGAPRQEALRRSHTQSAMREELNPPSLPSPRLRRQRQS